MKAFPLQVRSLRIRRRNAMRAGMAIAIAATTTCAVIAPNAFAAGDDSAASTSTSTTSSSHTTTGTKIRDATITTKAKAELVGTNGLSSGDIHVKTRRGVVTLTGSVPEEAQRTQAVSVVKQVDGVQDVRDQLTIRAK
ncbi:BON domain-containing protein [Burkholderia sp. AU38729]|uniref:BON domain-containing protein n=1 Tax=Burkholderia sp. AU38729 TaxID=2879633 RepID=UPI001CF4F6A0|nr:BON domain-containing protein [Burkholderia sp. AU38729]MCA8064106.1 BON domain-containing protein [Burkholderia sp. AU38729]